MRRIILSILLFTMSNFVCADDDIKSFIADANQHEAENLRGYNQYVIEAKKQENRITAPYKWDVVNAKNYYHALITGKEQNNFGYDDRKSNSTAIVFISFSMPEQSIVSYLREAKKIHATVVIRGLINNSFKVTFIKMASMVKKAGGGGVELNPPVFKKFNISQVPAVVVLSGHENIDSANSIANGKDYDVVYGDIPLYDALKLIRDHGVVAESEANKLLLILQDSLHE